MYMKTESMQKEERLEGTVKAVVTENGKIKYAYITDGKRDYPVSEGSVQRMENAAEVLVKGNKVSFTVYHGKKDYANDIRPAVPKVKVKKPKTTDISMLSRETQEFVEFCMKECGFNIQASILTTLFQPPYVHLSKEEYIAKYLERLSRNSSLSWIVINESMVIELIEHYWAIKKQS